MLFDCRPKVLHKHCLQFLLGVKMAPRETEDNAYAKFWGDKQRTLWYVMVFLEWSIDNREAVAAVAVDFSKALAFDAINHRLLLAKLKAYGFCPHALDTRHNYNVKWPNFELTWARDRRGDKFYSPSLNSDAIPSLQFQLNFPAFKWLGIRAKKFQRTRSVFFSDVFIGVAVVGS